MKAITISLLMSVMLLAAASAFASSASTMSAQQNVQAYRQWIGKPVTQVVKALGEPTYSFANKNGGLTYNYVHGPQHVGPVLTYQFVVGPNKKVDSARLSF